MCGDGVITGTEACDDMNLVDTDGCTAMCAIAPGYSCIGAPSSCVLIGTVTQVSLGSDHGCQRTSTGYVFCFGDNVNQEVGSGTGIVSSPARVPGLANVEELAAGADFTCARRANGTVACWGDSDNRQLGQVSTIDSAVPLDIAGITTAVQLAAGEDFACARLLSGEVVCWGDNDNRQLGRGGTGTTDSELPAPVIGVTGAIALAAGGDHACAIVSLGATLCWGDNDNGQLGLGGTSTTDVSVGTAPMGLPSAVELAAGLNHTCAITTSRDVWCWGDNGLGQMGDGTTIDQRAPVRVIGTNPADLLTAGTNFVCSVTVLGAATCWGQNTNGQLGDGTITTRLVPTSVASLPSGVTAIEGGEVGTCALFGGGARRCWGLSENGQLGFGLPRLVVTPTLLTPLAPVEALALSENEYRGGHACAKLMGGDLRCWGENDFGQLGDGTTVAKPSPTAVSALAGIVLDIAVSSGAQGSSCAVLTNGQIHCWGGNGEGQLGDGTQVAHAAPAPATVSVPATSIVAGSDFYCATFMDGAVRCWGNNSNGQLGVTSMMVPRYLLPTVVAGVTAPLALAAGEDFVCALLGNGTVSCWGDNGDGQLGIGMASTTPQQVLPVAVSGLSNVVQLGAGQNHACARTMTGDVHCWGANSFGQQANPTTGTDVLLPTMIPSVMGATWLTVGNNFNCVVTAGGGVQCWGYGLDGHFGDGGGTSTNSTLVTMPGVSGQQRVVGSNASTFLISPAGAVRALGFHGFGQLGLGVTLRPTVPTLAPF